MHLQPGVSHPSIYIDTNGQPSSLPDVEGSAVPRLAVQSPDPSVICEYSRGEGQSSSGKAAPGLCGGEGGCGVWMGKRWRPGGGRCGGGLHGEPGPSTGGLSARCWGPMGAARLPPGLHIPKGCGCVPVNPNCPGLLGGTRRRQIQEEAKALAFPAACGGPGELAAAGYGGGRNHARRAVLRAGRTECVRVSGRGKGAAQSRCGSELRSREGFSSLLFQLSRDQS